jgi:2-polyprenyl-3-methyl-5-hydroxy-6-metoxy-1,4-benzoquinol methylase
MTQFQKRFSEEQTVVKAIAEQYQFRTVIDAGCGTGFHSLILASLGMEVTAVDISEHMLQKLLHNANAMQLQIETVQSSFQQLHKNIQTKFDAVFCLGNSLPHLLTLRELIETVKNFCAILKPDGVLFLQLLNYERILSRKERIQNIREIEGTTFIRFYDFGERTINFNILKIERNNQQIIHSLESVELFPYKLKEINEPLKRCGFGQLKKFGSLTFDEFSKQDSRDLVIVARKQ